MATMYPIRIAPQYITTTGCMPDAYNMHSEVTDRERVGTRESESAKWSVAMWERRPRGRMKGDPIACRSSLIVIIPVVIIFEEIIFVFISV